MKCPNQLRERLCQEQEQSRDPAADASHRLLHGTYDPVLLYTDGATETHDQNQDFFGEGRLFELVQKQRHLSAAEIVVSIFEAARDFQGGEKQSDDITVVIMKCDENE